jgi:hypothetical protein
VSSYNRDALTINPIASTADRNAASWILNHDARALMVGPGEATPARVALDLVGMPVAAILVTQR